jgi:hypothetical protein
MKSPVKIVRNSLNKPSSKNRALNFQRLFKSSDPEPELDNSASPAPVLDAPTLLKLDLGCGDNKKEGFHGVDIAPTEAADTVHDLTQFPWPFEDETVGEIWTSHFVEHLTGSQRVQFMDECYRIMATGSQLTVITPYWSSMRSIQDPTHQWPPVCEASFLYFNKGWRDANKLGHYNINCDFDFTYGYMPTAELMTKNEQYRQFAVNHYLNSIMDLQVTLTKREPT